MASFVVRRLIALFPVVIGVTAVTFILMHLLPGDPAELYAGPEATAEEIAAVRQRLGLDEPLPVQYGRYVRGLLRGDLGRSIRTGRPVRDEIAARYPLTLALTALGVAIAVLLGVSAGCLAALRPRSPLDHLVSALALVGLSTPIYWLGLVLILALAVAVPVLPPGGDGDCRHLVLPSLALGLSAAGLMARVTRASLLEVLGQDYMRTAVAKGLSWPRALIGHGLPNAGIPVLTVLALEAGSLLGGAALTETIFFLNGLGRYVVLSIGFRDYPVVQGIVLVGALGVVLLNLLADVACAVVDPRLRQH